jgi:diguanylate cyclase (GGDEF)-like protein/PAS domain S-box-containing protein
MGRMPAAGAPPAAGTYAGPPEQSRTRAEGARYEEDAPRRREGGGEDPGWGIPAERSHPAEDIFSPREEIEEATEGPAEDLGEGMSEIAPRERAPAEVSDPEGGRRREGQGRAGPARGGGGQAPGRTPPGRIALAALGSLPKASTLVFDTDARYLLVVGRAPGHHGLRPEEIEGRPAKDVLGPDWWEIYGPLYRSALEGESRSLEIWSNDGTRCFLAEVGPLYDEAQEVAGGVAVFRDVTKRKRADEARYEAEERFELVFEQGSIGMALLTLEGRWERVNQALVEIIGHTSESLMAKSLQEITYPDDRSNDIEDVRALIDGEISEYRVEKRFFHARGHIISVILWVSVVRDRSGRPQNLIAQIQDITERKLMEERLHNLAEYDGLTGLRNRRLFEHELGLQVDRARRSAGAGKRAGESSALLIVDLDNFRTVNESAGFRTGDELLKSIAASLQERLRGTDLIARLDGDEFGVLLRGTPMAAAEAVAKGLREVVAECGLEISGRRIGCTASIGIAPVDSESTSDEAVRIAAEQDMFAEKLGKRRAAEEEGEGLEELPGEANYE